MGSNSKPKKGAVRVVPDDLDAVVREAIEREPGATGTQLMKVLPASFRAFAKEARAAAERLAGAGELYRHDKGKTVRFFAAHPMKTLDAAIPPRLAGKPLDKGALKRLVEEVAPGHSALLDEWLKQALARRVLYASKGSRSLFFQTDPAKALDATIPPRLTKGSLDKDDLRRLVEDTAPGHGVVLDAWIQHALKEKVLYKHAPKAKGAKERYGREPDPRKLFASLFAALRKACDSLDTKGLPKQRFVDAVLEELGVSSERQADSANGDVRTEFLAALTALGAENPRQALLSVRELRARVALGKEQFDALALELVRDGAISLHHHDHPAVLPEPERHQLVQDARGTYYVGIAPRRGP
jgi:hypothetical protein